MSSPRNLDSETALDAAPGEGLLGSLENLDLFHPLDSIGPLFESLSLPSIKQQATPSPEQQVIIDTWGNGLAVLAGAGSGKTTTLVSKCAQLIKLNPEARFAAVSFTERSASDLRGKLSQALSEQVGPGALHPHWVMTIHGLCGAIIREYPKEAGFDGEETVLKESDAQLLWERAIEAVWLEDLTDDLRVHLEHLLDRESRDSLAGLLKRVKELESFGVMGFLGASEDVGSRALEKVSQYVLERYTRLKQRQGVIDFNDLEKGADRALQFPHVCEVFQRRFHLVLVDEFQDTNPLQARIILRFARPDLSNLCVVGDPKQSIYRFRDADVSVFEDFCSRMPVQQSLTWNFRSRPGIIDFSNQVCEKTFTASEMAFEALVPKRESIPGRDEVIRLDIRNPIELGNWILKEVSQGVPLHDMALLVRKIRGNEKWFKALIACGIPIAMGSGGLFWEEPRVRELVSFLKWWDNPGNSLSGAIFLRSPWMGISDLDLDAWVKQDPNWRKPFFASNHPIAQKLKPLLNQVIRPAELLMALLIDQKIEDELAAPLLGLWHRIEEYSSRGLDFHAVVLELSLAVQENRREREVPAPKNLGQLSVLTFHGAKGLEFPHVILIDLGERTRTSDMPLLFWDRTQGAYLGNRTSEGERDRKNPVESAWRETEKRKSIAESKRLFYVALTRARERLILVCPELKDPDQEFVPDECFHEDFWRGWVECSGPRGLQFGFEAAAKDLILQPKPKLKTGPKNLIFEGKKSWTRARHSVTEWTLLSRCPRAYEWTFIRPREGDDLSVEGTSVLQSGMPQGGDDASAGGVGMLPDRLPEILPGELSGTSSKTWLEDQISQQELGTRVHACLERGDFEGLKALEAEVGTDRFVAAPVMEWALSCPWMAPADPSAGRTVWTELPFEVPLKTEVLVGSIDRLVLEEEGNQCRYTLVDFKVSEKSKSVRALREAYQIQMELYAWAVTVLDPRIQLSDIQAYLVNLSSGVVQVVAISLGKMNLEKLVGESLTIIDGEPGRAQPNYLCRYCEFMRQCPEGLASLTEIEEV